MAKYGFEYFAGANVVVSVGNMPILEAAGISYDARESKTPLYGYSSRHYDAVASGQVIVQGQLLLNYVHQDYLFQAINMGGGATDIPNLPPPPDNRPFKSVSLIGADAMQDYIAAKSNEFWVSRTQSNPGSVVVNSYNPFDIASGIEVTIVFGEQSITNPLGVTALRLTDLHFTGRSGAIRIDEEVIVESHSFFARDIFSLATVR